jgi:hypothetical protein
MIYSACVAGVQLLSNHGIALLCVARDPGSRLRDIARCVGITERATHKLVSDLCQAGYITRTREGNRNRYEVQPEVPMSHPLLEDHWVGELLAVLVSGRGTLASNDAVLPEENGASPAGATPDHRRKRTARSAK